MSQLSAVLAKRTLSSASLLGHRLGTHSSTSFVLPVFRNYSRKTKTGIQLEASELEREIRQLEFLIAEQERKAAAKKAQEDSIRESATRSETAQSVYRSLSSPLPSNSLSSSVPQPTLQSIGSGYSNRQSYLPETFLEDLKLTFLGARESKSKKLKQLQSGQPSAEVLAAYITDQTDMDTLLTPAAELQDANSLALGRIEKVDVDKWNQLVYINAIEGNSKNAEETMRLMEDVGVQPNIETFAHLIEAYANAGQMRKAEVTMEMIISSGLVPSISSYNSLMKIHVKRRDITSAFKVFEGMKAHHNPDIEVFTNLVKGCLRAGEYDLGWKVFDQMQHSGVTPVESTYSLMIHACAKTDQVERALDIFKTYPSRKLQPTYATFNSLIHACAMRPEYFATAFSLLNEMQNVYGFEPDILTYNTLLFACSKRQDLLTARRVFQKVVQLDHEGVLQLDGITVTNFLWCITEWKDMEVHLKSLKHRQRKVAEKAEPSDTDSTGLGAMHTDTATTDITVPLPYLALPSRPPKNEQEALAEGENVFTWFANKAAGDFPPESMVNEDKLLADTAEQTLEYHEGQVATEENTPPAPVLSLPKASPHSPIRTRLLNSYLAMYVRHNEIEKSTEIYSHYFDHFHRTRDSWTYATMLEGCYHWKNVDFGAKVFRDWRNWRKSTGKLTEKRTRRADYQCYRRMINLLARTNHLDESIALLEELSIAATPPNSLLLADIESAGRMERTTTASTSSQPSSSTDTSIAVAAQAGTETRPSSLSFLNRSIEESVLPFYPKLKDFPVVYTKTWEMEDEAARKLLLRLCRSKVDRLNSGTTGTTSQTISEDDHGDNKAIEDHEHRQARYKKALRNTSIKWKGEHPQEKRFYVGPRRIRELDRDVSKRGQDQNDRPSRLYF
ncbi:hypothetical protein BG004_006557 [Podila humilis]|nr:hypothetical protein BG004_006557 [Podila humilis]